MKPIEKALDILWAKAVKVKSGWICKTCRSRADESHHIVSRKHKAVRWEIDNGVALCTQCHSLATDKKITFKVPDNIEEKRKEVGKFKSWELEEKLIELRVFVKQREER